MKRLCLFIIALCWHPLHAQPIADSFLTTGINLINEGNYNAAIKTLSSRIAYAKKHHAPELLIGLYTNLGNAHSQTGNALTAIKYYQWAIDEAEAINNKRKVAAIMVNLGALFSEQKQFTDALNLFLKAEPVAIQYNDTMLLADIANNRGVIYEQQLLYDKALSHYQQALTFYEALQLPYNMALAYNNIAIVYKFLKNYNRAIDYYSASLQKAKEVQDVFLVAVNENNLANIYYELKNYGKAIELHKSSLSRARSINAQNVVVAALESLADDYAASGNYKAAHSYQKQFQQLNDSLFNQARSQQLAELQTKYETTKKEKEISDLRQKEQIYQLKIERQQLFLIMVLCLTALFLFAAYLFYSRKLLKTKQAKEKAVLDAEYNERMRIARDVHDDLGSGLTHIQIMAAVIAGKMAAKEDCTKDLENISGVGKALIDNMRDMIWVLNPDNTSLDHLFSHMREHCSNYLEENNLEYSVSFPDDFVDQKISRDVQRNIFLCVKESLHNCVKHANATRITLCVSLSAKGLLIEISDNGRGVISSENAKGNGIWNMHHRMVSIGGEFALQSSNEGCTVTLNAPLALPRTTPERQPSLYRRMKKRMLRSHKSS